MSGILKTPNISRKANIFRIANTSRKSMIGNISGILCIIYISRMPNILRISKRANIYQGYH
jgi:hypothetical protein